MSDKFEVLKLSYLSYFHVKDDVCCIPESFNKNISHQLFDDKITFVNSQHEYTNSKGDFVLKNPFGIVVKIFDIQKNLLQIWYDKFN